MMLQAWSRSPGPSSRPASESWWPRHERCVVRRPAASRAEAGGRDQELRCRGTGVRPAGGELRRPAGRVRGHRGAIGIGEVDPAAHHGHTRATDLRGGVDHRPQRCRADRPRAGSPTGHPDRLRVPAVLPGRALDGPGERRGRPLLRRRGGQGAAGAGSRGPRHGRARSPGRPSLEPALWRRKAASGDRPSPGRPAGHRPRGRAHRQSRQGLGGHHRRAARRTPCARHHHRRHHPRPGSRRPPPTPGRDPRRARRCRYQLRVGCASSAGGGVAGMTRAGAPTPKPLRATDLVRAATVGLRTRRLRAGLSALGIAIGVAAIVAVLGLSASSQAGLLSEIDRLGTNLLTVTNGRNLFGQQTELPVDAPAMIGRVGPVTQVQYTGSVNVSVYRSPLIPRLNTNAISVQAASLDLLPTVGTTIAQGSYLNQATATEPVAVLGAVAAQRLGIDRIYPGERVWLGSQWFYVAGILEPAVLAPEIDSSVLIGFPAAKTYLGFDGYPSTIYVRAQTERVRAVQSLLAETANPEAPNEVNVSQPSAALVARAAAQSALNSLFLGLGAVALLVGGVGMGNIMVIAVLERRSEIGLRRALGATRGHIRIQFLTEAIMLALVGGTVGVSMGAIATALYATVRDWPVVIPPLAWAGGLAAAVLIGAVAGLLPALRAARMSPTEALWSV